MLASEYIYKRYHCNQIHITSQMDNLVKWQRNHHCNMIGHGQSQSTEQSILMKRSRKSSVFYSSDFLGNRKC